ncbi:6755_t:CDS:2, partial [Gigaspora rosea]
MKLVGMAATILSDSRPLSLRSADRMNQPLGGTKVVTFNTPSNKVAVNANIILTWQYNAPATAANGTATGILSIVNSGTKDTTVIDQNVPLAPKSYQWKVNVPPGTYYLTLNDGTGDKPTGNFDVFDSSAGATPTTGPAPAGSSGSPSTGSSSSSSPSSAASPKTGAAP